MNKELIRKLANEILSTSTHNVGDLFEHPYSKIAISAGELIFKTNQRSIKYAKCCVSTSNRNDPHKGRWTFSVRCNQNKSKGPYDVRFRLLKGKGSPTQGILGREIQISCNCNAWKYNGADFNALDKDYSERQYSDGSPPRVRDPMRRYLICKHVAASIPLFRRFLIPNEFKNPSKVVAPGLKTTPVNQPGGQQEPSQEKQVPNRIVKSPNVKQPIIKQKPGRIKPIRPGQEK